MEIPDHAELFPHSARSIGRVDLSRNYLAFPENTLNERTAPPSSWPDRRPDKDPWESKFYKAFQKNGRKNGLLYDRVRPAFPQSSICGTFVAPFLIVEKP